MIDKAKWVSGGKTLSHWSDRYAGSPESRDQFGGLYVRERSPLSDTPSLAARARHVLLS